MQQFATHYKDVLDMTHKRSRYHLRILALDLLYLKSKWLITSELSKPRVQMMYSYPIFKDKESKFDILLDKLSNGHTFISHTGDLERIVKNEIDQLQKCKLQIGSHTLNHMSVTISYKEVMKQDLKMTFDILRAKCGEAKHFAYPYGRFFHFNEFGDKAIFDAGFVFCASVERGCHMNSHSITDYPKLELKRDHVIVNWKWQHIFYFLINYVKKTNLSNHYFPY